MLKKDVFNSDNEKNECAVNDINIIYSELEEDYIYVNSQKMFKFILKQHSLENTSV